MSLTAASLKKLEGVHPHLVAIVKRAAEISAQAFQVTEGVRTLNRQRELVKRGASRTLKSRHIPVPNGLGHAIDVVAMIGGRISWELPLYHRIADAMKAAAKEIGVPVEWGGDWTGFVDGPHFQLPWGEYPGIASVKDTPPPKLAARELATMVAGSHGEEVAALQRDLIALGQSIKADGQFGPATRAAVLAVTGANSTSATDIVTAPLAERIAKWARKAVR